MNMLVNKFGVLLHFSALVKFSAIGDIICELSRNSVFSIFRKPPLVFGLNTSLSQTIKVRWPYLFVKICTTKERN